MPDSNASLPQRLPNAHLAVVDRRKVVDYLLNSAHPGNGGKAAFFDGLGFSTATWATLGAALSRAARDGRIVKQLESPHGRKYVVDGSIQSGSGRTTAVRTIWIINRGDDTPRLVTAYPAEVRAQHDQRA